VGRGHAVHGNEVDGGRRLGGPNFGGWTVGGGPGDLGVLVVDDHSTFAELLALALDSEPDLHCVAVAADRETAIEAAREHAPDIAVVDLLLGREDGISLAADLASLRPGIRVVILTAHADQVVMRRASAAGVCGLLAKNGSLNDLLNTLRSARPGGFIVDPQLLQRLVSTRDHTPVDLPSLTPREQEARTAARSMGISLHTCRSYIKNVLAKLDAHSQLEAVATATRVGIVHVPRQR
jgi:DNA-binding NarL/FixJ family response regulator